MKKINIFFLCFFILACEQDEIPIMPHNAGDITTMKIDIGSNYSQQVYYSLFDNEIVAENEKTEWDLAFESDSLGWNITINSSTFSQIVELSDNFSDIINTNDQNWSWDSPEGIGYGTAIGDYRNKNNFYIIDRGFNLNGTSRGYKKFIIDSVNSNSYFVKYANLDNSNLKNLIINKDISYNFQYFSFDNEEIINIEPKKEKWDLLFTQYTHLFLQNTETPSYLVTGVLTNYLNNIMVAADSINKFIDIELNMIDQYDFSNTQNIIGYTWKVYDFTNQNYTVNSNITYIISDVKGRYFKLHFIDFYNENGEKGNPKFEIQEL